MRRRKIWNDKVYKTYRPYPVSLEDKERDYSSNGQTEPTNSFHDMVKLHNNERFLDCLDRSHDDHPMPSKSLPSNDERPLRPLRLLHSLFADRLGFLQRALDELESAKKERQQLVRYALDELDPEIRECEQSLARVVDVLNGRERRRDLERRLFDLKRERRRETLLNWRDLVWLKGEIRKLQREIDAIGRTAKSNENQEAPT